MSEFAKVAANMASVEMEPLQTGSAQFVIRAGKKRHFFSSFLKTLLIRAVDSMGSVDSVGSM